MVDGNYRRTRISVPQGVPLRVRGLLLFVDALAELALLAIDTKATVHRWTGYTPKAPKGPERR